MSVESMSFRSETSEFCNESPTHDLAPRKGLEFLISVISAQTDIQLKEPNPASDSMASVVVVARCASYRLIRPLAESVLIMREVKDRAKPVKR